MTAITIDDVTVTFGDLVALDSVSLDVEPGAIVGVLGHNGAGKTTLVRVAATLLRPKRGRVLIAGVDTALDPFTVRRNIGLTGQYAGLDEYLTPQENLEMVGRILGLGRAARHRAVDLLDRFQLAAVAHRRVGTLSGGTRRRVDLAASLVGSPMVLFLDEPTTGLDPAARIGFWAVVRELAATGTAVVLTTQYLEEADQLASEIVVIDHGVIVATGTPAQLKSLVGGKVVRATVPTAVADAYPAAVDGEATVHGDSTTWHVPVPDATAAASFVSSIVAAGTAVTDLEIVSPSLDDVFIHLANTGVPA
jgi:ABC-2 type transport system ATP-binding protein